MLYSKHAGVLRRSMRQGRKNKRSIEVTDEYVTLGAGCRAEFKVEGSRFIADALPVADAVTVEKCLAAVREEFHDATHHCYGYRLGPEEARSNDDGEPAGTAGRPILAAIDREGLTWSLVVVTRYFGGVKLGTGGLARAYAAAARQALSKAPREHRFLMDTLVLSFPHQMTGQVMGTLAKWGGRVVSSSYDEEAHLTVDIRRSRTESLHRELVEATAGRVKFSGDKIEK